MPTNEQILAGLSSIANAGKAIAVFWHLYFGVIAVLFFSGVRPPLLRIAGLLLGLPFFSVSIAAWIFSNPFNGIIFALIGCLVLFFSARLPRDTVRTAPRVTLAPGILLFLFGWLYPHFLDNSSFLTFLYAAPTGLIPCPTLSIVIGLALMANGLQSRAVSVLLGISGLFYGIIGVFRLGVAIDWVLLLGAPVILLTGFRRKQYVV